MKIRVIRLYISSLRTYIQMTIWMIISIKGINCIRIYGLIKLHLEIAYFTNSDTN